MPSLNLRNALKRNPNRLTLKQRAAALKATAARVMRRRTPALPLEMVIPPTGADPQLVALVAEWQDARRKLNDPEFPDGPEADAMGDRDAELQREIYLFPARTVADLVAKIPAFREEAEDALSGYAGQKPEETLPGAAWAGLLRDIAHLAGVAPAVQAKPAADLSKCSIIQLARLYELFSARRHLAALETNAPCLFEGDRYNPAGEIVEGEYERLDEMLAAIAAETKHRQARNEDECNERLSVMVRQSIEGSGFVDDPALVAEIATAWKA